MKNWTGITSCEIFLLPYLNLHENFECKQKVYKTETIQKSSLHLFWMFSCCSKSLIKFSSNRKNSHTSIDSSFTTNSELLLFVSLLALSSTLWPFSYYLITVESTWVASYTHNLSYFYCNAQQFVRLSVTCKINWAASKSLQNFVYFPSPKFWMQPTKPRLLV